MSVFSKHCSAFFILVSLICLFSTCECTQAQLKIVWFSSEAALDKYGNPNYLRAITDPGFIANLNLDEIQLKAWKELASEIENPVPVVLPGKTFDPDLHRSMSRIGHKMIESKIRTRFGKHVTDRVVTNLYRKFVAEHTILEFIALPEIADELDLTRANLTEIESRVANKQQEYFNQISEILDKALLETFSQLDSKKRQQIFESLKIDTDSRNSNWLLRGAYLRQDSGKEFSFLLGRELPIKEGTFDLVQLIDHRLMIQLEIVEGQQTELTELRQKKLPSSESNLEIEKILIPQQLDDLKWLMWREIYIHSKLPDFLSNEFVTRNGGFSKSDVEKFSKYATTICDEATIAVDQVAAKIKGEVESALPRETISRLKKMLGEN